MVIQNPSYDRTPPGTGLQSRPKRPTPPFRDLEHTSCAGARAPTGPAKTQQVVHRDPPPPSAWFTVNHLFTRVGYPLHNNSNHLRWRSQLAPRLLFLETQPAANFLAATTKEDAMNFNLKDNSIHVNLLKLALALQMDPEMARLMKARTVRPGAWVTL